MTTDELIRALAADRIVGPRLQTSLQVALLLSAAIVALLFFSAIGLREDIVRALNTARFLFKFFVVMLFALLAIGGIFRSATPAETHGRWERSLVAPTIALATGVLSELIAVPSSEWIARLIGSNAINCMTIIPTLGVGPLILLLVALRRGAPSNAGRSGALAGLAASAIAATFYATSCFDDSPLFVVTWYPLAASTLVLAGYLGGRCYLRW
ncbi:NrsF family protein [Bradyrhizobium sp. CAR08]